MEKRRACPVLLDKIQKLISSVEERTTELGGAGPQPWLVYHGHAWQIIQQWTMLRQCRTYYESHQPPCCGPGQTAPNFDPFPLPEWKGEPAVPDSQPAASPAPTPPNQSSAAAAAAATATAVTIILLLLTQ